MTTLQMTFSCVKRQHFQNDGNIGGQTLKVAEGMTLAMDLSSRHIWWLVEEAGTQLHAAV